MIPTTSPSQTGVVIRPQNPPLVGRVSPDQIGQWLWNPDDNQVRASYAGSRHPRNRFPANTVSSDKAVFWLTGDSIGPTTIRVRTSNPRLYVGMSERCAEGTGKPAQGS